jgi:hypothetical protein
MGKVANLMVIVSCLGGGAGFSQQTAAFAPILQLEKTVFVAGESVRLWVGVISGTDLPEGLRESGVMHIVCPDGSRIDDPVHSPRDGNPSRGWKGGWGFREHPPSPGRYLASFEFAGQKTSDQPFEIIPNPFANTIEAQWVFLDSKSGGADHVRGALLHIENKTGRVLRIAKPGLTGSDVWVNVKTFEPTSSGSAFVPQRQCCRPTKSRPSHSRKWIGIINRGGP